MDFKKVNDYLLSFKKVKVDYPYGKDTAVYFVTDSKTNDSPEMFALLAIGSDPVRLSLKCDPRLSKVLREKYITVMQGHKLDKKHWNTIILSGEIEWEEIQGFIRHSYDVVRGAEHALPSFTS